MNGPRRSGPTPTAPGDATRPWRPSLGYLAARVGHRGRGGTCLLADVVRVARARRRRRSEAHRRHRWHPRAQTRQRRRLKAPWWPSPMSAVPVRTAAAAPVLPRPPDVSRTRDPNGDLTPDLSDYVNAGEKPTMAEVIDAPARCRRLHRPRRLFAARHPPAADRTRGTRGLRVARRLCPPLPGHRRRPAHRTHPDVLARLPVLRRRRATDRDAADRVVPPELAPPGLPIRRIVMPAPVEPGKCRALDTPRSCSRGSAVACGLASSPAPCLLGPVRSRRRRLAARLRGPGAVAAYTRCEPKRRRHAAERLRDVGRLHGGGVRLVRHRDRPLHAARRGRRACCCCCSPRRCSSRNSSPSRWCATSSVAGTAPSLCALAGAAAWVATEWLVPKLLGDTLGYGLYPSPAAAPGRRPRRRGRPHAAAAAGERRRLRRHSRRRRRRRARDGRPLALAALVPLLLAGYGLAVLSATPAPVGQAAAHGAGAVEHRRLRAPAPREGRRRGRARGARHALCDELRRCRAPARATRCCGRRRCTPRPSASPRARPVPNSTARSWASSTPPGCRSCSAPTTATTAGEYNAAAFVAPGTGLLGFYRKTRLVPAHRVRARLARRADAAALAAVDRHLAAGHRRARVPAAPGRRPRDPGAAPDLPRRRGHRPRPSTAPGWVRRPS